MTSRFQRLHHRIWKVVDNNERSVVAKVYFSFVFIMVAVSIISQAYSTEPAFRQKLTKCQLLEYLNYTGYEYLEEVDHYFGHPHCRQNSIMFPMLHRHQHDDDYDSHIMHNWNKAVSMLNLITPFTNKLKKDDCDDDDNNSNNSTRSTHCVNDKNDTITRNDKYTTNMLNDVNKTNDVLPTEMPVPDIENVTYDGKVTPNEPHMSEIDDITQENNVTTIKPTEIGDVTLENNVTTIKPTEIGDVTQENNVTTIKPTDIDNVTDENNVTTTEPPLSENDDVKSDINVTIAVPPGIDDVTQENNFSNLKPLIPPKTNGSKLDPRCTCEEIFMVNECEPVQETVTQVDLHMVITEEVTANVSRNSSDKFKTITIPILTIARIEFAYIDSAVLFFFTVDMSLRLISCPSRARYFLSIINILDACALVTSYIYFIVISVYKQYRYMETTWVSMLNYVQIFRAFRLFRVVQNVRAAKVLGYSITQNLQDMTLLVCISVSGCLFFFAENRDIVRSIPSAWYWAVITMTTVGYGDVKPITGVGQLVASFCAIVGVLLLSITMPLFVNKFLNLYKYSCINENMDKLKIKQNTYESGNTGAKIDTSKVDV